MNCIRCIPSFIKNVNLEFSTKYKVDKWTLSRKPNSKAPRLGVHCIFIVSSTTIDNQGCCFPQLFSTIVIRSFQVSQCQQWLQGHLRLLLWIVPFAGSNNIFWNVHVMHTFRKSSAVRWEGWSLYLQPMPLQWNC
jgi:hypothetical protein